MGIMERMQSKVYFPKPIGVYIIGFLSCFIGFFCLFGGILSQFLLRVSVIYLVLGFGILRLKNWARITAVILAASFGVFKLFKIISSINDPHFSLHHGLIQLLILTITIWYLTRPKVKEQFK